MSFPDLRVVRYGLVGGLNTLFGLTVIYLFMFFFGLAEVVANALGYGLALLLSFILNKRWTFRFQGDSFPAFFRFLLVMGVAYIGNLITLLALISIGVNSYFAQAFAIIPYALIGYLGSRFLAFNSASLTEDTDLSLKKSKCLR